MRVKKIFFSLAIFLLAGLLTFSIFTIHKKAIPPPLLKEVKGIATQPQITPTPQETIPHGKFYAPILAYHHIALRRPQDSYYVSPEIFDSQMKWLKDNDYHVISFDKFYDAILGKSGLPTKPVVITFDDDLKDQYTNAFPILLKYGYTATFFIKMNNLNKGGMTWNNLRELLNAGNIVGSHSVNHDAMANMPPTQLKYELEESKNALEKNLGIKIKYFCYPGGSYSSATVEATKNADYLAAVTTRHKVDQEIKDSNSIYTLPRVHIDDEMPTFIDWVQGKNLK